MPQTLICAPEINSKEFSLKLCHVRSNSNKGIGSSVVKPLSSFSLGV